MTTIKQLEALRSELQSQLAKATIDRDAALSKTMVRCETSNYGKGCGAKTQIRKLTFIQTHWYVAPYSCTGGDYWNEGEGNFICPKCGRRNRLTECWGGGEKRKAIAKLKHLFANVENEYKRSW